jgi:hypothetical protein
MSMALEEYTTPEADVVAGDKTVSGLSKLSHNVFIFLDPETRSVARILAQGPFGVTEYDKDSGRYVVLGDKDMEYIYDLFDNYVKYTVDWDNEAAFDENQKSLALSKFSDGTLDEAWLKENTNFAGNPVTEE